MSLYFDNEKLFDAEGHLTDEGLYALKDGTLDDLGALEAAEHLSFCDYCLLRYTAMIEAAPDCMKQPMRDLIPQVQNLLPQQPTAPHERFGTKFSTAVNGFYKSLDDTFKNFTLTAESGLEQMRTKPIGGSTAKGE